MSDHPSVHTSAFPESRSGYPEIPGQFAGQEPKAWQRNATGPAGLTADPAKVGLLAWSVTPSASLETDPQSRSRGFSQLL